MKPSSILAFFVAIMASLLVIMLIFPKEGISVTDDISMNFPTFTDWMAETKSRPDSVKTILDNIEIPTDDEDDSAFANIQVDTIQNADADTVANQYSEYVPRPIAIDSIHQPLELPQSGVACLENIFGALADAEQLQSMVRILHYGDSQIETDRITGYMRSKLQAQFGGSGPGLVPAKSPYDYKSPIHVVNSGEWRRYTIFPKIDTTITHYRYGVLASFSMFAPPPAPEKPSEPDTTVSMIGDSLVQAIFHPEPPKVKEVHKGSINFEFTSITKANIKNIKQIRMFYGNCKESFAVTVRNGETVLYQDSVAPSSYYSIKKWTRSEPLQDLAMDFSGTESPEIYAFAMDGNGGVACDNIPLRGCSGTIFTKMNSQMLQKMYNDLHVKCVILQFGGNSIPVLKPETVKNYVGSLMSQVRLIRKICPEMSIIIIGPADMSTKVMDEYQSYEIIPELVEAMRQAAFANNCAFWDMYSAMGGWNSMPDWVFHEPPLGEKDFTHFSVQGANVIAKMFYNALIGCYNQYIRKRK
ncbi:MAG: hypothetical protein J6T70_16570 [Bacteroidales bacterium]|nr:hypothetical protein [Bacteroidales bacterium]